MLVLAASAAVYLTTVALLSEVGFTGNARYATAPAAVVCILGGSGVAEAVQRLPLPSIQQAAWAAVAALAALVFVVKALEARPDLRLLSADETVLRFELPEIIARAGGARAIRRCGPLGTTPFSRQAVAYALRVPQRDLSTQRLVRGTVLGRRGRLVRSSPLARRQRTASLVIRSTCPLGATEP